MPAIIDLVALRLSDPTSREIPDRMPKHTQWTTPLELERGDRVRIMFVGEDRDEGLSGVERALHGVRDELGGNWGDYFTAATRQ